VTDFDTCWNYSYPIKEKHASLSFLKLEFFVWEKRGSVARIENSPQPQRGGGDVVAGFSVQEMCRLPRVA
jgi:hypothetical protein